MNGLNLFGTLLGGITMIICRVIWGLMVGLFKGTSYSVARVIEHRRQKATERRR